jgi:PPOX class probable FMN-dependent enzyme
MIKSKKELRELYKPPMVRAVKKEIYSLEKHSKSFLTQSPFCVLSTVDSNGKMDASPRGGEPGFVKIFNDLTIVIPDAKGNNRLDSLENIVETGHVGLLFFLPGLDETLRINGKAHISIDPKYLSLFKDAPFETLTTVVVEIEQLFMHCAKAFMRSKLWSLEHQINPKDFPSMGQILKVQIKETGKPESREDMIERYKDNL